MVATTLGSHIKYPHYDSQQQQNYNYEVATAIILWLGSLQPEQLY